MGRWNKLAFLLGVFALFCVLVALGMGHLLQRRAGVSPPVATPAPPTPLPGTAIADDLPCDLYNCALTLTAGAALPAQSRVRLMLEGGRARSFTALDFTSGSLALVAVREGQETVIDRLSLSLTPGAPYALTVLRRGELLGLCHDGILLYTGHVPHAPGGCAAIEVGPGWTVHDIAARALEPVCFADDFMRTADTPGAWQRERGHWHLQTTWDEDPHGNAIDRFQYTIYAQNPFAWRGEADGDSALCTAGRTNWEDYTFTAAVRPGARGAVGLACNLDARGNGYLVRWSAASGRGAGGNCLALLKRNGDRRTVLASSPGGYVPGQWYQLAVTSSLEGLRVRVDGEERLFVPLQGTGGTSRAGSAVPQGKVGLYVEGDPATFNDVTVYGSTLKTQLLAENAQATIKQGFKQEKMGMKSWTEAENDWVSGANGMSFQKHEYYGDHWITLKCTPTGGPGTLTLALNTDGGNPRSGCRALIETDAAQAQTRCTLYRDEQQLAQYRGPALHTGEEYQLRLRRTGAELQWECDGETLLTARDPHPVTGHYPAYHADGGFSDVRDVYALGKNFLDYTFTTAPVDWIGEGTWMATMRWACKPKYSFYSGWSRGDAVLWHKRRFSGDQSLETFTAFKQEYPRETNFYDQKCRYHDMCLTICGDGHNPRTGYSVCSGLPDAGGTPNARTVLLRNGVPVAESPTSIGGWGVNHAWWYQMELRKRGDTVEFLLTDTVQYPFRTRTVITYRDPHPIDGGVPAIWTTDNGMSIARARIHFSNAAPVHEPRVFLDTPWFPEWADVGKLLAVDFPHAFSTTGQPVALCVHERLAPAHKGMLPLPAVVGRRVTFTPRQPGNYWYQVSASDGVHNSPPFDLFMPAYNPAAGRDDSHALLLYRFDEHTGAVVRDHGHGGMTADLHIPPEASTHWLPGEGLSFHGRQPLHTAGGVAKLMALKRSHAATLELWVSTDSSYPPDHWMGALLSWEKDADHRNFQVGIHMNTFILQPPGGQFRHGPTVDNFPDLSGSFCAYGIRTGLQHLVITWDGSHTYAYANGELLRAYNSKDYLNDETNSSIPWDPEHWDAAATLLLGNRSDGQRTYLGTYYLLAIHDKCFTQAEVQRNYQAGPAAR